MPLTRQDLSAIEQVLDRKLEEKLEQKLEEKLEQKLEEKLEQKLEQKLEPIKKGIKKMRIDLRGVIDFFDEEHQALRGRVDRIENILKIVKTS